MAKKQENPAPGSKLNFRNWRISTKLLVVMLILILVPLIIVTAIGTRTGAQALESEEKLSLTRLANSTALRISQLLYDNHNAIRMTANQPTVVEFMELETPKEERQAADRVDVNFQIQNLLASSSGTLDLVGVFDPEGDVVAHTNEIYLNRNYEIRDYFAVGISGERYTSGILLGLVDKNPGLISSTPILRDQNTIGVLSDRIKGDYITTILADTLDVGAAHESASKTEIYLVNDYGIVMSHSHSDPISPLLYRSLGTITNPDHLKDINRTRPLGVTEECEDGSETCPNDEKVAVQPIPIPALDDLRITLQTALSAGAIGELTYCRPDNLDEPDGSCQDHVIGYAPVSAPSGAPGTDESSNLFMVVVDIPADVFMQDIINFVIQGAIVSIIMAILGAIVALVVARMLAKPIGKLAGVAQDVEDDKPFEPADIADVTSLGDEVGHLARVFSAMVLALRARMADLRTIYEIGQEISGSVDLEETLHYILAAINRVIPYDSAELCFYDSKNKTMIVRSAANATGIYCFQPETANFYHLDEGYVSHLYKTGKSLLVTDVESYTENQIHPTRKWNDLPLRSYLGVALRIKSQVIGTIELVSTTPNHFSEDNRRLLESIAAHASIEVQNAQEVLEREQRLTQQIQQMDITIDRDKQTEQIDSIVASDFFKRVQKKSEETRKGKQK